MKIINQIPVSQKNNQRFENIKTILNGELYSFDHNLNRFLKNIKRADVTVYVKNGVHYRPGDPWHFNISIWGKDGSIIYNTLHVYVIGTIAVDENGNPGIWWNIGGVGITEG